MVKLVADSISQYFNNVPQMAYKAFEDSEALMNYTLDEGIEYKDNGETYTVNYEDNKVTFTQKD